MSKRRSKRSLIFAAVEKVLHAMLPDGWRAVVTIFDVDDDRRTMRVWQSQSANADALHQDSEHD